ncbi:MAG TPA: UbiX family flavin prenyltransferase [Bacteroidales bacterium]|nr:UbiX family flavin prenyltransferase [Bacteroidales bacterium]
MEVKRKIVLAITGASGSIYAKTLLDKLQKLESPPDEIAIILSATGRDIWMDEIGHAFVPQGSAKEYDNDTYYAPFASGSSQYDAMIICPASMGIAGRIANGTSDDLIARTADVMLKERRKLIIVPREAPYSLIHLENMKKLILAGAMICPASPSFYSKPETISDLIDTVVDRVIDLAGFVNDSYRWLQND